MEETFTTETDLHTLETQTKERDTVHNYYPGPRDVYMLSQQIRILHSHSMVQQTVDDPYTFFNKNHTN